MSEAASKAIVEFMEAESSHENGSGWLLLGTVNLLSSGGHALIDCMTAATLPSTFVKCLYLFFDLPPSENCDTLDAGCQFTHGERLILLQKVFVQVLFMSLWFSFAGFLKRLCILVSVLFALACI